jgi:hypothetical protein
MGKMGPECRSCPKINPACGRTQFPSHDGEVAFDTIDAGTPLTRSEVPRPSLPFPAEMVLACLSRRDDHAVSSPNWWGEPPHVGRHIRIARGQTQEEVCLRLIEAASERKFGAIDLDREAFALTPFECLELFSLFSKSSRSRRWRASKSSSSRACFASNA